MAAALEANKTLEEISVGNMIVGSTVKLKSSGELCAVHRYYNSDPSRPCITLPNGSEKDDVKPSEFEPIPAVLPLKKLRDNTITELDLKSSGLGVDGGMMLAAVLKSNSSVTKVSDDVWLGCDAAATTLSTRCKPLLWRHAVCLLLCSML